MSSDDRAKRQARWYFGGTASAMAACITHPLDIMKVHKQTQQEKLATVPLMAKIFREEGIGGIYSGLSASFLRQMTYSMTRFGMYEIGKDFMDTSTMLGKTTLAGLTGLMGGFVGTPADMINVRMQNDVKLERSKRRNYKNGFDGLIQVYKNEGFKMLFSGATTASVRGALITIGQIAFYEEIKRILIVNSFADDIKTHLVSSIGAAAAATLFSQPLDVMKTRAMNAKKGEYSGMWHIAVEISRAGPIGFFKGFLPAFIRIGPHTVLLFLIFEQLRLNFGYVPATTN